MRLSFIPVFLVLSAVMLSGCVTAIPPHEALPVADRDQITSTDNVVPIRQSEIYVFVPPSTGGTTAGSGFGLLGVLVGVAIDASIDSARTSKAEKAVKPLRDAVVDYDFDATMRDDLKNSLSHLGWLHADNSHVIKEFTPDKMDQALANSKDAAVLFTNTDYHLSNDGDELFITMAAALYPNSDALKALKPAKSNGAKTAIPNSLYHNSLVFRERVPGWATPNDRDKDIAIWSAQKGAATRAALTTGEKELATMLVADIARQDADVPAAKGTLVIDGKSGDVIDTDPDGSLLRFKDGTLLFDAAGAP